MTAIPTQSAKELVIQFVREKNPQTMELKFGCVLRGTSGIEFLFLGCERWRGHDKINYWKAAYTLREYPFERLNSKAIKEPNMQTGMDEYTRDMLDSMNSSSNVCINGSSNDYKIIGSEMGLQELLIATQDEDWEQCQSPIQKKILSEFDLTKNLHNQPDKFFTSLLPLIMNKETTTPSEKTIKKIVAMYFDESMFHQSVNCRTPLIVELENGDKYQGCSTDCITPFTKL